MKTDPIMASTQLNVTEILNKNDDKNDVAFLETPEEIPAPLDEVALHIIHENTEIAAETRNPGDPESSTASAVPPVCLSDPSSVPPVHHHSDPAPVPAVADSGSVLPASLSDPTTVNPTPLSDPTSVPSSDSASVPAVSDPTSVPSSDSASVPAVSDPTSVPSSDYSASVPAVSDPTSVSSSDSCSVPAVSDPTSVSSSDSCSVPDSCPVSDPTSESITTVPNEQRRSTSSVSDGLILVPTTDHPLANLDFTSSVEEYEPVKEKRRVRFHENEAKTAVLSYHAAPDPWCEVKPFTPLQLVQDYKQSCYQNNVRPIQKLINQLTATADVGERYETLTLRGERLDRKQCDALEEVLKRVQFKTVDLEATDLDDDSAGAVFDMIEFYDSATRLVLAYNKGIGPRGWQACSRMLKRTPSLLHLDLRSCAISDHSMPFIGRALRVGSLLQVLHLENAGISNKVLLILVAALKLNDNLRELYLADNRLMPSDGIQLGNLLKYNDRIQLLDLRNNHLQDTGTGHVCDGLEVHDQKGWGLTTLVLWNNQITQNSMARMAQALAMNRTLETLNLGHNNICNEGVLSLKEGLLKNKTMKRLGLQSCRLLCEGAIAVAELIADSQKLLRIDLRDNEIKTAGLMALSLSLKMNQTVTRLDLDKEPKKERAVKDYLEQQASLLSDISNWLQRNREQAYCMEQEKSEISREVNEVKDENTSMKPQGSLEFTDDRVPSLESPMVTDVTVGSVDVTASKPEVSKPDVRNELHNHRRGNSGRMFSVKYVPENSLHVESLPAEALMPPQGLMSPTLEFPLSLDPEERVLPVLVPVNSSLPMLLPVDQIMDDGNDVSDSNDVNNCDVTPDVINDDVDDDVTLDDVGAQINDVIENDVVNVTERGDVIENTDVIEQNDVGKSNDVSGVNNDVKHSSDSSQNVIETPSNETSIS